MQKTLFNRVFSDLKDTFRINMPSLCYYLTQLEDEAMEVWIRPTLALYKEYSGKKNKTSDDYLRFREEELEVAKNRIVHFTSSIVPSLKELNFFIDGFKKYLDEQCNFSTHINEFYGRLGPILMYVNNQSRQQGLEDISLSVDLDFIGKLLWRAWVLSQPNSTVYPTLHFEDAKLQGSPCFIGREALVDKIVTEIAPESQELKNNFKSVYLHGIGGIGKTEVVRAVVQKLRHIPVGKSNITDIVWIDLYDDIDSAEDRSAQQSEEIKQKICMALHPNGKIKNLDQEYASCKQELFALGKGLLIVIDNIEVYSDEFQKLYKSLPFARFIIAGRLPSLNLPVDAFTPVPVERLSCCKELFGRYCNYTEQEGQDVDQIIELADHHTVTVELLAKLANKQEVSIGEFLQALTKCGFDIRFKGEEQETVSSAHYSLKRERHIIDQLALLFRTDVMAFTDEELNLLIQISVVPNVHFEFKKVKAWFALNTREPLYKLVSSGWLQCEERTENKKIFWIHSIIAAAVRSQHSNVLHDRCQSFIVELTQELYNSYQSKKLPLNLLIQFSWSITDIFKNQLDTVEDISFLYVLSEVYKEVGYLQKSVQINDMIMTILNSNLRKQT